MSTARQRHQAVLLPNGQVLVAGGENASGTLASTELYNPSTGTWTPTGSMITPRTDFSLTLLSHGKVLAAGGTTAELYDPATGTWSATGSPPFNLGGPNAATLQNGQVLANGAYNCSPGTCSDAVYNPLTGG